MRTELWATLAGLMDSLAPTGEAAEVLRLSRVELDLPIEMAIGGTGDDAVILAEPPGWRWPTAFDRQPARMQMLLVAEAVPELPLAPRAA
jgi:hypothetical protein